MSEIPSEVDILVIGAGPCGAGAARAAAVAGRSVLAVDARPLDLAGVDHSGALPRRLLRKAGIEPPLDDAFPSTPAIWMVAGASRAVVRDHDMIEVRLGRFSARLRSLALAAGARLIGERPVLELGANDRKALEKGPIVVVLGGGEGRREVLARLVVDATGLGGVGHSLWPELARSCPPVDPRWLCHARMEDHEVQDPAALRAWLDAEGVQGDDALCFTGNAGGWSVELLQWHRPWMAVLGGSIPGRGNPSGPELQKRLLARTPGLGACVSRGEGFIPLRRPYERLAAGPVVLLGSSASQVYSGNACGVATGLLAAGILGECVAGESWEPAPAAWRYACRFQREWGGFLASSTLLVDLSSSLGAEGLSRIFAAGLFTPSMLEAGYSHRRPMIPPRELALLARGLRREPRLARSAIGTLARMAAVQAFYALYPSTPDPRALESWSARTARIAGWEEDHGTCSI